MDEVKLLKAKYVVTNPVSREKGVIENGGICIQDKRIVEVGHFSDLQKKFPRAGVIGSDNHIALPGFLDIHNHAQGSSKWSQGLADNLIEVWSPAWPRLIEKPADLAYWDTLVAASRQIRSGVTTTMPKLMDRPPRPLPEYKAEVDRVLQAYDISGMRVFFAIGNADRAMQFVYIGNEDFISSLPDEERSIALELSKPRSRITLDQCQSVIEELHRCHRGNSRINISVAITGPQWLSDAYLIPLVETAKKLGIPIHGPILESPYQKMYALKALKKTVFAHFFEKGFLGPQTSFAHCVWATEEDIEILARTGATVVHCPSANLRSFDGIAPVAVMLERGVNVALAVDSNGINEDDDTFQEMRMALLLHRIPSRGKSPDEWDVLSMATINGARAVMMEKDIGSIERGKFADIVLIKLDRITKEYYHPSIHPVVLAVRRGRPADVDVVMVEGKTVYSGGKHADFDEEDACKNLKGILQTADWTSSMKRAELVSRLLPHIKAYYQKWHVQGKTFYLCNGKS
jgi:5-methylthioadenosine/S-adenosylhomocysteine deaminase